MRARKSSHIGAEEFEELGLSAEPAERPRRHGEGHPGIEDRALEAQQNSG